MQEHVAEVDFLTHSFIHFHSLTKEYSVMNAQNVFGTPVSQSVM